MSKYWRHRNLGLFSYDSAETERTADKGKRTTNDWNRQAIAGDKCSYYINGVSLAALRSSMLKEGKCAQLGFTDEIELKQFFKDYIFQNISDKKTAEDCAESACLQWQQAGIQHATYQHIWAHAAQNFPRTQLSEPNTTVNFNSTDRGVEIIEENIYKKWTEMLPNGKIRPHESGASKEYYAMTRTAYEFTPKIEVRDLIIDCPSRNLAPIFDKRPTEEQMPRSNSAILRALYSLIARISGRSLSTGDVISKTSGDAESETTDDAASETTDTTMSDSTSRHKKK